MHEASKVRYEVLQRDITMLYKSLELFFQKVYYKCLSSSYSPLDKTCASSPFPTVPNHQIFNCLLSCIDKQTLKVECVEVGRLSAFQSVKMRRYAVNIPQGNGLSKYCCQKLTMIWLKQSMNSRMERKKQRLNLIRNRHDLFTQQQQ